MKTACVLLANGFEEVEAVTPIDYLRRVGVAVTVVGIAGAGPSAGGQGVSVLPDAGPEALAKDYDCIIVPGGGGGSKAIAADPSSIAAIQRHCAEGRIVAAICAAPGVVLHGACGLLKGKRFTGYPGTEADAIAAGAIFVEQRVVRDGNLITSRGAGTAGEFACAVASALVGKAEAEALSAKVLLGA
jgi:4-methyl-5(b-hydroxyethyl)-thiazole monophosphate biosynthesis